MKYFILEFLISKKYGYEKQMNCHKFLIVLVVKWFIVSTFEWTSLAFQIWLPSNVVFMNLIVFLKFLT
jgi:hypothetical protein